MEPSTVRAFANMVYHPSCFAPDLGLPSIAMLVRHLRLGVPLTPQQIRKRRGYGFSFPTIDDIPVYRLPNLETLSIAEIPGISFHMSSMKCLCEDFRSVKNLHLHRGLFAPETLTSLLSGFPRLVSLSFHYKGCPHDGLGIRLLGDGPPRTSLPSSLNELSLGLPDPPLVEWLVQYGGVAPSQLTSLEILFQPLDDLRPLQAMLYHVGKTLTDLTVGYVDPPYVIPIGFKWQDRADFVYAASEVFAGSTLRGNTVLRVLRIEGCDPIERTQPPEQALHSWIPTLLRQVQSKHIEEVTFAFRRLRQTDSPMLSWMDWVTIEALLDSAPLNQVRRIIVEVEQSEIPQADLYRRVAVLLPLVARRDALRVRCIAELSQDEWDRSTPRAPKYMTVLDCVDVPVTPIYPEAMDSYEDYIYDQREWEVIRSANGR
ncbi:hypothetical protein OH77DRAFT_624814 [Trametes cingulata]|nr:hypothetical protein OH77DRAFT_624814 [Trametes cingulata]